MLQNDLTGGDLRGHGGFNDTRESLAMCKWPFHPRLDCIPDVQTSPASLYSFSFAQNPEWSTLKPQGREILQYLNRVCEKYGILDKIQFDTEVSRLKWDEDKGEWNITLRRLVPGTGHLPNRAREASCLSEIRVRAKIVISAVGKLIEPKVDLRHLPGVDKFKGAIVHTGRWDDTVNLRGKDVIVIGSGCSAVQVIPELISSRIDAKSVTQVIRSPPWVNPDVLSPSGLKLWERWMPWLLVKIPGLSQLVRVGIFLLLESEYFRYLSGSTITRTRLAERRKVLENYIRSIAPREYHEVLIPDYDVSCKRLIRDSGWLRSLENPRVKVSTLELLRLEEDSVILSPKGQLKANHVDQVKLPADAIVLATGYETDTLLPSISVTGRQGTDLHTLWHDRGGPQGYLGLAVDNFPNFFLLNGPNSSSSHTSVVIGIENAVLYSLKFIKPILNGSVSWWEPKEEACINWTAEVQAASTKGVWVAGGCTSWYVNHSGWNIMIYP